MAAALTPPFEVAALVLCAAGLAKLRWPDGAVRALITLGLPARRWLVRALAAAELALGLWSLLAPERLAAALVAVAFGVFAPLSLALARRHVACGCFGAGDAPASPLQAGLSGALAAGALAAAGGSVHGVDWVLAAGPLRSGTLVVGIAASAYAVVIAYTELPQAWEAWSGR